MKERPVFPLLMSMALPNVISMLVNSLYNIVDRLFVARINESAMTALSLVFPVQNLLNAIAIGFGIGINALVALCLGAGEHEKADQAATHGMAFSLLHGILGSAIAIAIMPSFLGRFTTDAEVLSMGLTYSHIVFGFATVNMASLALEKIFQSVGRMKVTMVALIVGCVGNIILDPLLIFGIGPFPAMGIAGAALATGIGQALSTGVYLVVYASTELPVRLRRACLKLDKELDEPSSKKLYSYSEDYGYGLTGWLKVVVENGRIRSCRFDEIFADNEEDIVHPELKKYYRQSKYDCPAYEDPFPSGWDRHAFLVGFRTQMDNLNLKVCATQNMLDLTGLPHAAGRDMGMIWDNPNPDHAHLDMDPKNRPMYPAFINYLRMAKVVLEEMRKDGVFQ